MNERPTTYRVSVWNIVKHTARRRYGVCWKTEGREHSEWYATKALAESFRSQLLRAQRAGEAFEIVSGLPVSLARKRNARTLLEVATSYVDWLWSSGAPPNTRKGAVTSLAAVVPLFVRQVDHAPDAAALQRLLSTRLLARRPYDLRHAALSSWLAAGVPPTEVAERAGNSVKVLLTVYAKCLDGQRSAYNERITTLLGE